MTSMTIRNLDPQVKQGLRLRAAENGRSMEQEVRLILTEVVLKTPKAPHPPERSLEEKIQAILALGRKPDVPFDHKKITDELWDFVD